MEPTGPTDITSDERHLASLGCQRRLVLRRTTGAFGHGGWNPVRNLIESDGAEFDRDLLSNLVTAG